MRREREAMGLPPLPTTAAGDGRSSAATVTGGIGAGIPEEVDFQEGVATGREEDKLMWLAWPFQVRNLVRKEESLRGYLHFWHP